MPDIPDDAIDVSNDKDEGVMKVVKTPGTGDQTPMPGDNVKVHYVGTLFGGDQDGKQFDSSRDRGDPFSFGLGGGRVIKGWDQGVATMKKGEICDLYCKPDYAYGESGSPPSIPPNSTLKFEVELLSWEGEDMFSDGGVIRSILRSGEGYSEPKEGAKVVVHIKGSSDDKVFEDHEVSFVLGDGESAGICSGIEKTVSKMKKLELAKIVVKGEKYLPSPKVLQEHGLTVDSTVTYEVELKQFEKFKENWELNNEEKISQAELMKSNGTDFFKAGKYHMACIYYNKCIRDVEQFSDFDDEEQKSKGRQLLIAGRLNLALCSLKQNDYNTCIDECTKVIGEDDKSDKAYFRRGQAKLALKDYDAASEDFKQVRTLDPANKAALTQLNACQDKIKEFRMKEKKTFYGMFDKFAKIDAKKDSSKGEPQETENTGDNNGSAVEPTAETEVEGEKMEET